MMNDRKIITEQELNYIETLYLYCNLEDFTDTIKLVDIGISSLMPKSMLYSRFLDFSMDWIFDNSEFLGTAKGRDWYKFKNFRMGIMSFDTAQKANQFNCVIQYEQAYLFTLDIDLKNIVLPFGSDFSKYHIKRIDITKVAKCNIDYTRNYGYISPYRRSDNVDGTVYLGHRKNGNVFRMYDKTKELKTNTKEHPINYKKIELFSRYFGDIEDLYTFELELSRAYLKNTLGIDTLSDLSKVFDAYYNIVGSIKFYKDNDRNKRLIKNNHRDRISCKVLTDFIEYDRIEKKQYKPSFDYAVGSMISLADKYINASGLAPNDRNYMTIINALLAERVNIENELVISFEDSVSKRDIDHLKAKHKLLRDNQSNELEIESERHFGTIKIKEKNG